MTQLTLQVQKIPSLKGKKLEVYRQIRAGTGYTGFCYSNDIDLAERLGISERTLKRYLKALEEEGLIWRRKIWTGRKFGRRLYCEYEKISKSPPILTEREYHYHQSKIRRIKEKKHRDNLSPSSLFQKKKHKDTRDWEESVPPSQGPIRVHACERAPARKNINTNNTITTATTAPKKRRKKSIVMDPAGAAAVFDLIRKSKYHPPTLVVQQAALKHGSEKVQNALKHMSQQRNIRNPGAYFRRAIEEGWGEPLKLPSIAESLQKLFHTYEPCSRLWVDGKRVYVLYDGVFIPKEWEIADANLTEELRKIGRSVLRKHKKKDEEERHLPPHWNTNTYSGVTIG